MDKTEVSPAFGAYPLTATQRLIVRIFHSTPLGFSRLRRPAVDRFRQESRGGLVDGHLFGLKVRFRPSDNQTDAKGAVCGSCYNADETRWLKRALPHSGGVFVDVGANMGFFSLFAAKLGAKVVAIEPIPTMFERLRTNMRLNDFDAWLFPVAVGAAEGMANLVLSTDYGGSSIALKGEGIEVPVRPLLSLLAEAGVNRIDALKIDIEGYEDRALIPFFETAPKSLWPGFIIIEHSSHALWETDLMAELKALGYRIKARNRGNSLLGR